MAEPNAQDVMLSPSDQNDNPADQMLTPMHPAAPPSPYSDTQKTQTAALATLADHSLSSSTVPLASLIDQKKQQLDNGQEAAIRDNIGAQAKSSRVQAIRQLQLEKLQGFNTAPGITLKTLLDDEQSELNRPNDPNTLEREGVQTLQDMATSDAHQAAAISQLPGAQRMIADNAFKVAIWNREADVIRQQAGQQGILGDILDGVLNFVPGLKTLATTGISPNPAGAVNAQMANIWSLPPDQFPAAVRQLMQTTMDWAGIHGNDPKAALSAINNLYSGLKGGDYLTYNAMAGLDVAPILASKALRGSVGMLLATGNRQAAADLAAHSIVSDRLGMSAGAIIPAKEAIANLLPSVSRASTPSLVQGYVGISRDLADSVEAVSKGTEQALIPQLLNRSPDVIQQSVTNAIENFKIRYRGLSDTISDIKPDVDFDEASGVGGVNIYLGREAGGGGFASPEAAIASADRRGFGVGQVGLHQNVDAQWFLKYKSDLTTSGTVLPDVTLGDIPETGGLFRYSWWLKNGSSIMPDAWNEARLGATFDRANLIKNIYKPLNDIIAGGASKEWESVVQVGQKNEHWFNADELNQEFMSQHNRLPTDNEVRSYYAYKDVNDANWRLKNHYIHSENSKAGWQTVQIGQPGEEVTPDLQNFEDEGGALGPSPKFKTVRVNGRVEQKPEWNDYILDQNTGVLHAPGTNNEEFQRMFDTGNYRLVQLQRTARWNGDPVRNILVHKNGLDTAPLDYRQLGYIQGGNVEYTSKYFVKQANIGTFTGDKGTYYDQPLTHIQAQTQKQAQDWADSMERARLAYIMKTVKPQDISKADLAVIEDLNIQTEAQRRSIIEQSPWSGGNYDKFDSLVKQGKIRTNAPFRVLYDKEIPPEYQGLGNNITKWFNGDESAASQYFWGKGRMYVSPRGERLPDPDGNLSNVLSPLKTTQRAINNALNTTAFSDYNRSVIEDWSRIATAADALRNPSPDALENFFHGELKQGLDSTVAGQLTATRQSHLNFLNQTTPMQLQKDSWARRFAEFIDDKPGGTSLAKLAFWAADRNVTNSVKGFVFDSYLGLFNIGQFVVQGTTGVAAMAVHPLFGARAAASLPAWTHVMINRSENLLDWYAKTGQAVHGMDPMDWKTMVKSFRQSGWGEVGNTMTYLDSMTGRVGNSIIGNGLGNIRELGRQPFYLGEKFNRAVGYQIAWNKVAQDFPDMTKGSDAFLSKVNTYTDNLTWNMAGASKANWQKGIWSWPTTFMQYQAHMLENILPQALGGSRAFQGAAKARLAASQLLMYGAGGVGGVDLSRWMNERYKDATGADMSPETYRGMSKGIVDSFLHYASGGSLDTDISSRVGPLNGFAQYFEKVASGDLSSTLGVFTGPAGTETSTILDSVNRLGRYFAAEQPSQISSEEWGLMIGDTLKTVKQYSYASKALWLQQAGMLLDQKTGEPIVKNSEMERYAEFLGIPLAAETERFADRKAASNFNQVKRDVGGELARSSNMAWRAMGNGDEEAAQAYTRSVGHLMSVFTPMQRLEILRERQSILKTQPSNYVDLLNKMQQTQNLSSPYKPRQ